MTAPQATQQAAPSLNDFLLGGESRAGRSLSFPQIGHGHTGTIAAAPEVRQQRDPDDGSPKFWPNSTDPIWQIVVPLQTDYRSAEIEGDDGIRYLYVDGSKRPESKSKHAAVAEAVRAAGANGLEVGGKLTITYVANGPKSPNAPAVAGPPKQYQAVYVPAANAALMSQPEQNGHAAPAAQPAPQQQAAAPAVAPAAQTGGDPELDAALASLPAEQAAAYRAAGLTLEQLRAMGLV
jgi:hypothetical protein